MKKLSLLCIATVLIFASCKKEGCINENATNFNADANTDDGSCNFQGKAIFWFDSDAALNLAGELLTDLEFYIDDELIGTREIDQYVDTEPTCGSTEMVNYNFEMGTSLTQTLNYKVTSKEIDNTEKIVATGTVEVTGGICKVIKIEYE